MKPLVTKEVLPSHLLHIGTDSDEDRFFISKNDIQHYADVECVENAIPDAFNGVMEDDFRGDPAKELPIYPYPRTLILSKNCPYWIECLSFLKPIIVEDREITSESTDEEVERRR